MVAQGVLLSINANAYDVVIDGIYYNLKTGSHDAIVTSGENKYTDEVVIPESFLYKGVIYSVTSIGSSAFDVCRGLTSVTIPNSVTSIDGYAFNGCSGLTSLTIPNSVTSIGYNAFSGCSGLTSVNIGNSVTSIGNSAFGGCSGLTSVNIPNSVTTIGIGAFSGCSGLTSINIPNSVTTISEMAFYNTPWYDNQEDGVVYVGNVLYNYKGTMPDNTEINIKDGTVSISDDAFYYCRGLTAVNIPNSVMSIGSFAFYGCNLTSVNIPNSVTSIGDRAFNSTPWYDNQEDGVVYVGNVLYNYKGTMPDNTEINIKDGTVSISEDAFSGCSNLTSVTIPNSITSIGDGAFWVCSGLTSITIPNSVTSIGNNAFSNCHGLTSITIPNSVTSIGNNAFSNCHGLTSITISNSVTSIGNNAFSDCHGLTSITIPNSVTCIGDYAFYYCLGLTSVTIPNSVTSIGRDAFSYCGGLTSLNIGSSVTSIGSYAFSYCRNLTSVSIPNSVTGIGQYAFRDCSGLSSITIPSSVTGIGNGAFRDCSGLSSILVENGKPVYDSRNNCNSIIETASNTLIAGCQNTIIPNSVTSIDINAFAGCSSLTSANIPSSITSIGDHAFYDCKGLTSLTIPNSVTSIGYGAFSGCSGLTSIFVEKENPVYDSRNNCNSIIETASNTLIAGCQNTIIPNDVTSIDDDAFSYCSGLTSITIPSSVTSIGSGAFLYSGLTSITIPNSVTSIGISAFDSTPWYNNQEDGVVYLGNVLYKYKGTMPNNTEINIKDGTVSISDYAFYNCRGLTSVTIPNSVTSIGGGTFNGCSNLTAVNIPNSVTSIGDWAFYGCYGLTSVTIPNGVTTIGRYAFSSCYGLTSVTIPNSVTSIDYGAFGNCWSLTSVICHATKVPTTDTETFYSPYLANATLYVPEASIDAYKTTEPWSSFGTIIPLEEENIEIVPMEEETEIAFADNMEEGQNLSGVVIDNIYFNLNAEGEDGFLAEEKCVVVSSVVSEEQLETVVGKDVNDEAVKENFNGLIMEVTAGKGTISITIQTVGSYVLNVKIGDGEVQTYTQSERGTVEIPYMTNDTSYVYIYGTILKSADKDGKLRVLANEAENYIKIYSIKWTPTMPSYTVTYMIDEEVYKTYTVEYGADIAEEAAPEKEGYIFSGWDAIPTTMPAHDVTITGKFTFVDGIADIHAEDGNTQIFTLDGKRVEKLQKGVNILRMGDGTVKKVFVK